MLFLVLFLLGSPAQAALIQIGAAAAVAGRVTALAPKSGSTGRRLSSGKTVYAQDKISTNARGRLQVLFQDETVFTLGPDTEIVLDEFIYNPFDSSGDALSTRVNKGTFRFVSGKVARKKPGAMKIKLPTGTMGIRGTIAGGTILPDGSILIALLGPGADNNAGERPGAITVTNAGQTINLTRPGFATIIRPGQPPSPPFPMTPQQLAQLNTKPKPQAGTGDPESTQEDAKATGAIGNAKTVAKATGVQIEDENENSDTTTTGAQDSGPTPNSWDAVRSVDASTLPSGRGYFRIQNAAFDLTLCGGATCADSTTGDMSMTLQVDFQNQTYGGNCGGSCDSSSVSAFDTDTVNNTTVNISATINETSFSTLTGNATINPTASNSTISIELQNVGSTPAGQAQLTIDYSATGPPAVEATGTVTIPRVDGFYFGGA